MSERLIKLNAAIISCGSVVGKKEHDGPLGEFFDIHSENDRFGKDTWERAEGEMQRMALALAMKKGHVKEKEVDAMFAGDLLNQCVGSAYGLLGYDIPYFGLYGACSTCAEGIMLAAMNVSCGNFSRDAAITSSHFCSAERQYRTPVEYGGQRPPTAQWTVTGSGAFILEEYAQNKTCLARITSALPGIVIEKGINDANNMGAAMAPAAASTVERWFKLTGALPKDIDLILTGDLGHEGGAIICDLLKCDGIDISDVYNDCGKLIFDQKTQDTHAGGSGCGCSASVLAGYILPKIKRGELKRVLFIGTGAMMSPDAIKQGENIPAIGHLVELRTPEKCEDL